MSELLPALGLWWAATKHGPPDEEAFIIDIECVDGGLVYFMGTDDYCSLHYFLDAFVLLEPISPRTRADFGRPGFQR